MKILRVISSINPENGGPINGLINSSSELVKRGHSVDVLCLDDPDLDYVRNFDFPVVAIKGTVGRYGYSSFFSEWLRQSVSKFDVVVIHGLWQFHSCAAARACVVKGVPYVVFTHGMLDPWFTLQSKSNLVKKNIYWKLIENRTIKSASNVLFTSEEEKQLARSTFSPYLSAEKVVAYGSPTPDIDKDIAKISFLNDFPNLKGKEFGLFLSRIHAKKGVDLLIEALAKIRNLPDNFVLAIAGPDSNGLQAKLTRMIKELGLEHRIVWLGMLSGNAKWGAYHAADVFILPSHQENFGIVVAEALSTATPVLITNKVNIWREIKFASAGFVEEDDVAGVGKLIKRWLVLSKTEKEQMSDSALLCYESNFSILSAVDDLEKVLIDTVGEWNE
jgi:glycosyltransferase involved in cell wall biosynthesis